MMQEIKTTNEILATELKEVKDKLSSQTKVIDVLKDSLDYFSKEFEDFKNENQVMHKEMKLIKESNACLTENIVKVQKNERALSIRVNFLKGNNVDIQGVAVSENGSQEDLEKVIMAILKILEPTLLGKKFEISSV